MIKKNIKFNFSDLEFNFFWKISFCISCFKSLLIPAYRSTDFEVHRNWLAITHSLPIKEWYESNVSEWTVDYPPLFAWMEKILSYVAFLIDKNMLIVQNLNYSSQATIVFQRLSVVFTEMVLIYALYRFMISKRKNFQIVTHEEFISNFKLYLIFLTNFGLFLVDHIHFQYNGILFGILLLSFTKMFEEKYIQSAFWFTILICMKHIYLYIAPVYFIYLLKHYCLINYAEKDMKLKITSISFRMIKLGAVVIGVFLFAFLPFIYTGQMNQVLSRLFPFKRGLCHAYWAPNFWSFYNFLDKIIYLTVKNLKLKSFDSMNIRASMTGGLVQEFTHQVLPSIKPIHTFLLAFIFIMPSLYHIIFSSNLNKFQTFIRSIVLCAYGSYMFAWHVHEKAVLLMIVPLTLLCVNSYEDSKHFLFLSSVGHFSLFPLIFTNNEQPIKYLFYVITIVISFCLIGSLHSTKRKWHKLPLMNPVETIYIYGLILLKLYILFINGIIFSERFPFLPLMLISVYCSLGIIYIWLRTVIIIVLNSM